MNRSSKKLIPAGLPHERRHPLENGGVKITTFVPLRFKKRGVKKVIVGPNGGDGIVRFDTATPVIALRHDTILIKAIGRGHFWQNLLDIGAVADTAEIAEREGIHRGTVNEVLRLALLAPDVVEAAMDGSLPRSMSLESLFRTTFPVDWEQQRAMIEGLG